MSFFGTIRIKLTLKVLRTHDFLNMEFAFKFGECGNYLDMSKSLKPRIWLQYQLDISVCLKQKIFFSYHTLTIHFGMFGFENCVVHKFNVNLSLSLCDIHLQNKKF